jgi:hypothetical protein
MPFNILKFAGALVIIGTSSVVAQSQTTTIFNFTTESPDDPCPPDLTCSVNAGEPSGMSGGDRGGDGDGGDGGDGEGGEGGEPQ